MEDEETSGDVFVARIRPPLSERLGEWAKRQRRSKNNAAEFLLERGLDAELVREAAAGQAGAVVK